ncbi:MAG: OmpA family protein, partial [Bacteroidetes bacterium]
VPKPKDPEPEVAKVPELKPSPNPPEEKKEEEQSPPESTQVEEKSEETAKEEEETVSVQHTHRNDTTTYWVDYKLKYIGKVYFVSDSFNLDKDDYEILEEVVQILKQNPDWRVLIEGRANNIPSDEYIRQLAANRSQSVVDYLISKGISEDRINVKAFGKKNWKIRDYSLYSRRKDQRVDIKILARKE